MLQIEAVCCTPEECVLATRAGATRIELCSAIELGGVTPSAGLIQEAISSTHLPVMVMIRPRPGDFVYSDQELSVMQHDIHGAWLAGATGVVFGALLPDGRIDLDANAELVSKLEGMEATFHRAFDQTPDAGEAMELIVALGFNRILTSGHAPSAFEGAGEIRQLLDWAGLRIQILPGGGVRAHNARELIERTGCVQLHLAPFKETDGAAQIAAIAAMRL